MPKYSIRAVVFCVLTLLATTITNAQDTPVQASLQAPSLPDGNDVWAVSVMRSGGFSGTTMQLMVSSKGQLRCVSCTEGTQSRTLSENSLKALAAPFLSIAAFPANVSAATSSCRDCFQTRVIFKRRDLNGKVQTYTAAWDDVTAGKVPADIVRFADSIVALLQ